MIRLENKQTCTLIFDPPAVTRKHYIMMLI